VERFPGERPPPGLRPFGAETLYRSVSGTPLTQNWMRDDDPTTGRYLEAAFWPRKAAAHNVARVSVRLLRITGLPVINVLRAFSTRAAPRGAAAF
jgi:hypothetical protein